MNMQMEIFDLESNSSPNKFSFGELGSGNSISIKMNESTKIKEVTDFRVLKK